MIAIRGAWRYLGSRVLQTLERMSHGPNLADVWRRAAAYVDKLLKGAKPADLPVEQPGKYDLVINRKTAKALGLTIRRRCCCERIRSSNR